MLWMISRLVPRRILAVVAFGGQGLWCSRWSCGAVKRSPLPQGRAINAWHAICGDTSRFCTWSLVESLLLRPRVVDWRPLRTGRHGAGRALSFAAQPWWWDALVPPSHSGLRHLECSSFHLIRLEQPTYLEITREIMRRSVRSNRTRASTRVVLSVYSVCVYRALEEQA